MRRCSGWREREGFIGEDIHPSFLEIQPLRHIGKFSKLLSGNLSSWNPERVIVVIIGRWLTRFNGVDLLDC